MYIYIFGHGIVCGIVDNQAVVCFMLILAFHKCANNGAPVFGWDIVDEGAVHVDGVIGSVIRTWRIFSVDYCFNQLFNIFVNYMDVRPVGIVYAVWHWGVKASKSIVMVIGVCHICGTNAGQADKKAEYCQADE